MSPKPKAKRAKFAFEEDREDPGDNEVNEVGYIGIDPVGKFEGQQLLATLLEWLNVWAHHRVPAGHVRLFAPRAISGLDEVSAHFALPPLGVPEGYEECMLWEEEIQKGVHRELKRMLEVENLKRVVVIYVNHGDTEYLGLRGKAVFTPEGIAGLAARADAANADILFVFDACNSRQFGNKAYEACRAVNAEQHVAFLTSSEFNCGSSAIVVSAEAGLLPLWTDERGSQEWVGGHDGTILLPGFLITSLAFDRQLLFTLNYVMKRKDTTTLSALPKLLNGKPSRHSHVRKIGFCAHLTCPGGALQQRAARFFFPWRRVAPGTKLRHRQDMPFGELLPPARLGKLWDDLELCETDTEYCAVQIASADSPAVNCLGDGAGVPEERQSEYLLTKQLGRIKVVARGPLSDARGDHAFIISKVGAGLSAEPSPPEAEPAPPKFPLLSVWAALRRMVGKAPMDLEGFDTEYLDEIRAFLAEQNGRIDVREGDLAVFIARYCYHLTGRGGERALSDLFVEVFQRAEEWLQMMKQWRDGRGAHVQSEVQTTAPPS